MNAIEEFTNHGESASYHYADDSGREWGKARTRKEAAMEIYQNATLEEQEKMREIAKGFLWSHEFKHLAALLGWKNL